MSDEAKAAMVSARRKRILNPETTMLHGESYNAGWSDAIEWQASRPVTEGLELVTDRAQGVDCYLCEDGSPHTHRPPGTPLMTEVVDEHEKWHVVYIQGCYFCEEFAKGVRWQASRPVTDYYLTNENTGPNDYAEIARKLPFGGVSRKVASEAIKRLLQEREAPPTDAEVEAACAVAVPSWYAHGPLEKRNWRAHLREALESARKVREGK